jgi:hypothetical protein
MMGPPCAQVLFGMPKLAFQWSGSLPVASFLLPELHTNVKYRATLKAQPNGAGNSMLCTFLNNVEL